MTTSTFNYTLPVPPEWRAGDLGATAAGVIVLITEIEDLNAQAVILGGRHAHIGQRSHWALSQLTRFIGTVTLEQTK